MNVVSSARLGGILSSPGRSVYANPILASVLHLSSVRDAYTKPALELERFARLWRNKRRYAPEAFWRIDGARHYRYRGATLH